MISTSAVHTSNQTSILHSTWSTPMWFFCVGILRELISLHLVETNLFPWRAVPSLERPLDTLDKNSSICRWNLQLWKADKCEMWWNAFCNGTRSRVVHAEREKEWFFSCWNGVLHAFSKGVMDLFRECLNFFSGIFDLEIAVLFSCEWALLAMDRWPI